MSLNQLLALKNMATEKAYQDLFKARSQYSQSEKRHLQLTGYRLDYMQQMESIGCEGGTLGQLRNRIEFINNLDTALAQLSVQLKQLAKQQLYFENLYTQAKTEEDAVKKLIERKQALENQKIQRSEQKDSDEYAQKQWYTNQSITKTKTPIE